MNVWESFKLRDKLLDLEGVAFYKQRHPVAKIGGYIAGCYRAKAVVVSRKNLDSPLEPYIYIGSKLNATGFWLNDTVYTVIDESEPPAPVDSPGYNL